MVSTIKLPILKKVSKVAASNLKILPPKTAVEILTRERERKAKTTLLMAVPDDHLAKFHNIHDAKELWESIKTRFGGNDESKKIQKILLKQQFETFSVSNSEGLYKGYDRFQSLLSQLEIHRAGVSSEDANQKFLRSLPSTWSNIALIMRNKLGIDSLDFDDLYNNLRVYEVDVKGTSGSSSNSQNVAFVSSKSTSSTNELILLILLLPQLDHEDLEQIDECNLEEMDLKWQVAMLSMRVKKFYTKTGRKIAFDGKEPVGFDKTKVECYNCHRKWHFARECRAKRSQDNKGRNARNTGYKRSYDGKRPSKQDETKALVVVDGAGAYEWSSHAEDEPEDYVFTAYTSNPHNNSSLDSEVTSCTKEYKTDVLTYTNTLLAEATKEKEELRTKLEKFETSSKNLTKLLDSQLSAKDKVGPGYDGQIHESEVKSEVLISVFDNHSSDEKNSHVNDIFAKDNGYL
ncbi:ribonuclease H-like domain-containing protein [Tanacetum coccineum]